MDSHREAYREEANELLSELEASLLELEEDPDNMEVVGRVFRAMHTIKGSGAMFGFEEVAGFTHEVESVYDSIRDSRLKVTKELVDASLHACDLIRKMVEGKEVDPEEKDELIGTFTAFLKKDAPVDREKEKEEKIIPPDREDQNDNGTFDGLSVLYRIRFRPERDIFKTGTNPLYLLDELRELGDCRVIARAGKVPFLPSLDPESCHMWWDVVLATGEGINAIRDVFIFVEDHADIEINDLGELTEDEADQYKRLGEILVERGELSENALKQALSSQKRLGEVLVESERAEEEAVESALFEQSQVKKLGRMRKEMLGTSSIRVAAEKLDTLVDLVGEMVTVQARLNQRATELKDTEMTSISEVVQRLVSELRDNTMSIRMVPIYTTFNKFKRLVRDLADELGKEVHFITEGGETELDKTVIEQLNDPLVHLIRNSLDHGIELPDYREKIGKPRYGTVRLSAAYSGSNVLIRVSCDGKGLDPRQIRTKATDMGLISQDAQLTDKEVFALISAPGFSTAKTVSGVSGRGVGMDVVRRKVESLRGTLDIDSKKGQGMTVTLRLPLTLAIQDGLLVLIGEDSYIIPLHNVEECVELERKNADRARDRRMINYRGEMISYLNLKDAFGLTGDFPEIEQVVIVASNGDKFGFAVDRVIGQHQTVIKNLGKMYNHVEGLSGATILGDGTVALILDVNRLIMAEGVHSQQQEID